MAEKLPRVMQKWNLCDEIADFKCIEITPSGVFAIRSDLPSRTEILVGTIGKEKNLKRIESIEEIEILSITPDGKRLVMFGSETRGKRKRYGVCKYNITCFIDIPTWKILSKRESRPKGDHKIAISHDSKRLVSSTIEGGFIEFEMWDLVAMVKMFTTDNMFTTKKRIQTEPTYHIAFSADNKTFVTCDYSGCICVWDAENGNMTKTFGLGHLVGRIGVITALSELVIYPGNSTSTITTTDTDTQKERDFCYGFSSERDLTVINFSGRVIAYTKKGQNLTSISRDIYIQDIDEHTTKKIDLGLVTIVSIEFSRDGEKIFAFSDCTKEILCVSLYPFWSKQTHHVFTKETKKCVKMLLREISAHHLTIEGINLDRRTLISDLPRDIMFCIFSFTWGSY
jgi:WD40 repeat protein